LSDDPRSGISVHMPRAPAAALEHLNLVAQDKVLEHEGTSGLEAGKQGA
jgi:hypothetical protein